MSEMKGNANEEIKGLEFERRVLPMMEERKEQREPVTEIIEQLNRRYGTDFTPADRFLIEQIVEAFKSDSEMVLKAQTNTQEDFRKFYEKEFINKVIDSMCQNLKFFTKVKDDPLYARKVMEFTFKKVNERP